MEPVNNNQVIADLIADAKQQRDDIAQSVQQLIAIRNLMREALRDAERCVSEAHNAFNEAEFYAYSGMDEPTDPDEIKTVGQMLHWSMENASGVFHDAVIDDHDV